MNDVNHTELTNIDGGFCVQLIALFGPLGLLDAMIADYKGVCLGIRVS